MSYLRGFGRFWWDFVVGDEWRIALIVAVATALGVVASLDGRIRGEIIACGVAVGDPVQGTGVSVVHPPEKLPFRRRVPTAFRL